MTVYLDKDFKCHVTDDGTMTAYETNFFDSKCTQFIEGYRLVPRGEAWVREDGKAFEGLMIAPWMDVKALDEAQRQYEQEELRRLKAENAEYEAALSEIEEALGVNVK